MEMYASFGNNDFYDLNFIEQPIIAKDGHYNGYSNRKEVILCQCTRFLLGDLYWTIKFNKTLEEIYVDWDDDVEFFEVLPEGKRAVTYQGCDEKELKKGCMYGSYVKDIKPHEIIEIYATYWNSFWWCKDPLMIPMYKRLMKGVRK